jgi:hypothetical protein
MRAEKIRLNQRGVGDCAMAKGHETYGLFFETYSECKRITDDVYSEFEYDMVKPDVRFTGLNTKRTMGTANYTTGRIRLNKPGENVAVLLHELAHLFKVTRFVSAHGHWFKNAQTQLLMWWEKNRDRYVDSGLKVGIKETPTIDSLGLGGIRTFGKAPNPNNIKKGDRVCWRQKKYGMVTGTVVRMNTKTATIKDHDAPCRGYFRVSPKLLSKVVSLQKPEMPKVKIIDVDTGKREPLFKPEDTDEENRDMIHGLMDSMKKYAVWGSLSMKGIIKCFWVNGIKNTDENRKIALDYVRNELGLKIR